MTFPWASCSWTLCRKGARLSVVRSLARASNDTKTNARIAARLERKGDGDVPPRGWDVAPGEILCFRNTGNQTLASVSFVVEQIEIENHSNFYTDFFSTIAHEADSREERENRETFVALSESARLTPRFIGVSQRILADGTVLNGFIFRPPLKPIALHEHLKFFRKAALAVVFLLLGDVFGHLRSP